MTTSISDEFFADLTKETGLLFGLAARVRSDDTLMLALRDKSIDVYYRGGRILHLVARKNSPHKYIANFDRNYAKPGAPYPLPEELPSTIETPDHCQAWLNAIPVLKEIMNFHLTQQSAKSEREFQQLVAWENNRSKLALETEYFITDIEHDTDVETPNGTEKARLDMLGLTWLSADHKDSSKCTPVFIEMKYGMGALTGRSGIIDHIADLNNILSNKAIRTRLNQIIASQFNRLDRLKLIKFNKSKNHKDVVLTDKPEVVFLLSNVNPRSKKLSDILKSIDEPENYKLRFFVANFAGYGMHEACMMDLEDFKTWVNRLANS
jgi:hypothetical protein